MYLKNLIRARRLKQEKRQRIKEERDRRYAEKESRKAFRKNQRRGTRRSLFSRANPFHPRNHYREATENVRIVKKWQREVESAGWTTDPQGYRHEEKGVGPLPLYEALATCRSFKEEEKRSQAEACASYLTDRGWFQSGPEGMWKKIFAEVESDSYTFVGTLKQAFYHQYNRDNS